MRVCERGGGGGGGVEVDIAAEGDEGIGREE